MNEDRALIVDVGVSVVLQVDASRYRTEQIDEFDDDGLESRQEERRRQHRDSRDRIALILGQACSEDGAAREPDYDDRIAMCTQLLEAAHHAFVPIVKSGGAHRLGCL